jgi:hypothetical protein
MNKILIFFVLFTALGVGYAYAEKIELEIEHEIAYQDCMTFADQYGTPFTQCIFEGVVSNPNHLSTETDDGCEEGYDRDYITQECKDPVVIMEEAIAKYEEQTAVVEENKTPREKLIDNLEEEAERHPLKSSEQQLLDAVEKLNSVCKNDILQFQTYNEFEIPTIIVRDPETGEDRVQLYKNWDLVAIDLKTNHILKQIYLATEACIAQNTLATEIISEATTNKIIDDSTTQTHHSMNVKVKGAYPQNSLDASGAHNAQAIRTVICESQHFTQGFKDSHACPKPDYISTIEPTHDTKLGDEGRVIKWANEQFRAGDADAIEDQYDKVRQAAIDKKMENLK